MALLERLGAGWRPGWWTVGLVLLTVLLVVGLAVGIPLARHPEGFAADRTTHLTPEPVVRNRAGASTGTQRIDCGVNANGHRNADNLVAQPGRPGGAMHEHDYVGNVATDAFSTEAELRAAATTCAGNDLSTYYWPVLRVFGPGSGTPSPPVMENAGRILTPESVAIEYRGNPVSSVIPMPDLLRAGTGNARGMSQHGLNTGHVRWGCSGQPGRSTLRYPECPAGQKVTRTADFPSCWDGRRIDSPTHREHLVFPDANGVCAADLFAVPELHVVLTYAVPQGVPFAIDTMPTERRSALTDHFDFISIMPEARMTDLVACVNAGRTCTFD